MPLTKGWTNHRLSPICLLAHVVHGPPAAGRHQHRSVEGVSTVRPTALSGARLRTALRPVVAAIVAALLAMLSAAVPPAAAATNQFHGVNWADPRDNYADDPVVPSGLSDSDDYATTYAKAAAVIAGFKTNLGANTVRLPVNPYTVNGPFWSSYTGAVDAAVDAGFKVVLSYWEGTAAKDGQIDDTSA